MNILNSFQVEPCVRTLFTPLLTLAASAAALCAFTVTIAHADTFGTGGNAFTIPFVPIGNAGNGPDPATGNIYGAVSYNFNMSTYAVSQDDMNLAAANGFTNGTVGNWTGSQPATNITWYQAAAFLNWLNTSQGYTAAYNLDAGATTLTVWSQSQAFPLGGGLFDLYRNASAHYFLPTDDEYYKAAYHANDGVTADYFTYATGSNTVPTAVTSGTAAGTAVYNDGSGPSQPFQPAAVDQSGGLSPYGTMGQIGNVYELEESAYNYGYSPSEDRVFRGAFWNNTAVDLPSSSRYPVPPSHGENVYGFRVASIATPEPSSTVLIIGPCLMFLARRRRARSL